MPEYTWITDDVFTVDEFLSAEECEQYVTLSESLGFDDAPINTTFGAEMRPDLRNNQRVMLDDVERAEELWSRIRDYVPLHRDNWAAIGVNERLRFYRYDVGQQFQWHYDGSFERTSGERSLLTFMVYLNERFLGGETSFGDLQGVPGLAAGKVVPKTGRALVFAHPLLHRGAMVLEGRKYVLRTDVMYRPND